MDMSNEILQLLSPNIISLESFYTNVMKSELIKVANEYKDNPDEARATDDVINTIHAVIKIENNEITLTFECDNETWLSVINDGLEAPMVTGGNVNLPQGGTRQSKAAVTGGIYLAAKETASLARDNGLKISKSLFKEDIENLFHSDEVVQSIKELISQEISQILGGDAS